MHAIQHVDGLLEAFFEYSLEGAQYVDPASNCVSFFHVFGRRNLTRPRPWSRVLFIVTFAIEHFGSVRMLIVATLVDHVQDLGRLRSGQGHGHRRATLMIFVSERGQLCITRSGETGWQAQVQAARYLLEEHGHLSLLSVFTCAWRRRRDIPTEILLKVGAALCLCLLLLETFLLFIAVVPRAIYLPLLLLNQHGTSLMVHVFMTINLFKNMKKLRKFFT